jgi:molybdopterin converting factor subunit 1
MRCDVLLFAQLAEEVGTDRLTVELPNGATAGDALAALARDHAPIERMRETLAVAVNDRYCDAGLTLDDRDTIALIPPVSGG